MAESWHWFVLDLAQARRHAVTLFGDRADQLVGDIPDDLIADALSASVAWYALHEPGPDLMLAAARAWRWHVDGRFVPKGEAWAWAQDRVDR